MNPDATFYLPLYLQYFDRELATAVAFEPSPELICRVTRALLLTTPVALYCNISTTWECPASTPVVVKFLAQIVAHNQLHLLSHHKTLSEFLAARQTAYQHDSARYPMYFSSDPGYFASLRPTDAKPSSATTAVHDGLRRWCDHRGSVSYATDAELDAHKKVKKTIARVLDKRTDEAVTFSLFSPYLRKACAKEPRSSWFVATGDFTSVFAALP